MTSLCTHTSAGEGGIGGDDAAVLEWPDCHSPKFKEENSTMRSDDTLPESVQDDTHTPCCFDVDTICVTAAVRTCCVIWCYLSAAHKLKSTVEPFRDVWNNISCFCFSLNFKNLLLFFISLKIKHFPTQSFREESQECPRTMSTVSDTSRFSSSKLQSTCFIPRWCPAMQKLRFHFWFKITEGILQNLFSSCCTTSVQWTA